MGADEGRYGPSWFDVEQAVDSIERRYDCKILVTTTLDKINKAGRPGWWVQAHAKNRKELDKPSRAVGAHAFRGNNGSATFPAALLLALTELEVKLDDAAQRSYEQARF